MPPGAALLVPPRVDRPEIMDRADNSAADLDAALRDIRWTNRWLGGRKVLLDAVRPFLQEPAAAPGRERPLELLDVGTGGADLPRAVVDLARRLGRDVRVTAVDRDPVTAAIARRDVEGIDEIDVVVADALDLPFAAGRFDLVTASLFLHHFDASQSATLLRAFRRLARRAVIVNDLRRHRLPWLFIHLVSRLTFRHPMYRHDAPLSVLRGFTDAELHRAAEASGDAKAIVRRRWPFRLLMTLDGAGSP